MKTIPLLHLLNLNAKFCSLMVEFLILCSLCFLIYDFQFEIFNLLHHAHEIAGYLLHFDVVIVTCEVPCPLDRVTVLKLIFGEL